MRKKDNDVEEDELIESNPFSKEVPKDYIKGNYYYG
jgi:hypothetical protein